MNQMIEGVMALTVITACFLFLGWIIWMISRTRRERLQSEIELRTRVLDKFGSSEEFTGFMQTEAGRKFLQTGSLKAERRSRNRVASSLSWGAILLLVGMAFFLCSWVEHDTGFIIPASLFAAVGMGLALSAYFYHRLDPETPDNGS
jgi:uncharacterized membrane protein